MDLIMRIFAASIIVAGTIALCRSLKDGKNELMYLITGKDEYLGYTESDD